MNIKKAYKEIVELLESNVDATVSEVLPQILELCAPKKGGGSGGGGSSKFHRNEAGEVVAIFDYYFKAWMDPRVAEFGKKASSATGYNSMSKEGVSNWTKQQSVAKKANDEMVTKLLAEELDIFEAQALKTEIEEAKAEVKEHSEGYGFATLEECLEDSLERGLDV